MCLESLVRRGMSVASVHRTLKRGRAAAERTPLKPGARTAALRRTAGLRWAPTAAWVPSALSCRRCLAGEAGFDVPYRTVRKAGHAASPQSVD
jgi:hypothetical protein